MFSLPQGSLPTFLHSQNIKPGATAANTEVISLNDDSCTLEPLLHMICRLKISAFDMWDAVKPVLYTAEKYNMPGPTSIVHMPVFVNKPLRLYTAACHFGWAEDMCTPSGLFCHCVTDMPNKKKLSKKKKKNRIYTDQGCS